MIVLLQLPSFSLSVLFFRTLYIYFLYFLAVLFLLVPAYLQLISLATRLSICSVPPECSRWGKLTELVAHHIFTDEHRHMLTAVVDLYCQTHKIRCNHRTPRPGPYRTLVVGIRCTLHLFHQMQVDKRSFLQTTRHLIFSRLPAATICHDLCGACAQSSCQSAYSFGSYTLSLAFPTVRQDAAHQRFYLHHHHEDGLPDS